MITSQRKGFLTASFLILLLVFAISAGSLNLVQSVKLSENSIGIFDGHYIKAKEDLQVLEAAINSDPEFPDFLALEEYLNRKNYLRLTVGDISLIYIKTQRLPDGASIHRFKLSKVVNGEEYIRFIQAQASKEGQIKLFLSGITG